MTNEAVHGCKERVLEENDVIYKHPQQEPGAASRNIIENGIPWVATELHQRADRLLGHDNPNDRVYGGSW